MRYSKYGINPFPIMLMVCCALLLGCGKHAPNAGQVQAAVDQAVDWARVAGSVQVIGVQENTQANEATADLQFNNFQYKANSFGTPIAKTTQPPRQPDANSPNFWAEMANWPSRQFSIRAYSGQGRATLKRYNEGGWVLANVEFNFQQLNTNIPISR